MPRLKLADLGFAANGGKIRGSACRLRSQASQTFGSNLQDRAPNLQLHIPADQLCPLLLQPSQGLPSLLLLPLPLPVQVLHRRPDLLPLPLHPLDRVLHRKVLDPPRVGAKLAEERPVDGPQPLVLELGQAGPVGGLPGLDGRGGGGWGRWEGVASCVEGL